MVTEVLLTVGSPNPFRLGVWSDEPGLGFALWALQHDGLPAPPFVHHPDGAGVLRAAGMTATDWRTWLDTIIADQVAAHAHWRRPISAVWPARPNARRYVRR